MGEITDALRRARERGTDLEARGGAPPRLGDAAPDEALPRAPEPPARAANVEISLDRGEEWPARAIVVEPRGQVAEALRHLALQDPRRARAAPRAQLRA